LADQQTLIFSPQMDTDETQMGRLHVDDEVGFPHKETTAAIIGAAFEVHQHLGFGFLERVYQRALQVELARRGHTAEIERRITVRYKEVIVGEYDADLVVDSAVVVEIKVAPQYDKRDEAQLLNELKATGLKLGLLLNFGRAKVEFRRFAF
jgi:GxxExxY protein